MKEVGSCLKNSLIILGVKEIKKSQHMFCCDFYL